MKRSSHGLPAVIYLSYSVLSCLKRECLSLYTSVALDACSAGQNLGHISAGVTAATPGMSTNPQRLI